MRSPRPVPGPAPCRAPPRQSGAGPQVARDGGGGGSARLGSARPGPRGEGDGRWHGAPPRRGPGAAEAAGVRGDASCGPAPPRRGAGEVGPGPAALRSWSPVPSRPVPSRPVPSRPVPEPSGMDHFCQQVQQKDVGRRLQVGQELLEYLRDPAASPDVEQDPQRLDKVIDELAAWVNSSNFKVENGT
nr:translation initiation factor IF-2-like isoform X2 [Anas platyrhynchos]